MCLLYVVIDVLCKVVCLRVEVKYWVERLLRPSAYDGLWRPKILWKPHNCTNYFVPAQPCRVVRQYYSDEKQLFLGYGKLKSVKTKKMCTGL